VNESTTAGQSSRRSAWSTTLRGTGCRSRQTSRKPCDTPASSRRAAPRERIVLGHPFNPSHLIPLVEVGGGKLTSPENVSKAIAFYASTGKKPIRIHREVKGHIANRLQVALWQEAISLVQRGVASVEDIDTAIAYGPGLRWALLGPFLNLHASGGAGGITHLLQHLGPRAGEPGVRVCAGFDQVPFNKRPRREVSRSRLWGAGFPAGCRRAHALDSSRRNRCTNGTSGSIKPRGRQMEQPSYRQDRRPK
jgi:hypothetical protein